MTSFYVICGLGLLHSKILGSLINRRSPEKIFEDLFFRRTLAAVTLVLGLGLEHSCPWPREGLSSKRLSLALASDFFCVLGLGLGLEPCVLDSTSGFYASLCNNMGLYRSVCVLMGPYVSLLFPMRLYEVILGPFASLCVLEGHNGSL